MKKFFSLVAVAFASVAMFAYTAGPTPATVPATNDFNQYKAAGANVVVGFYTEAEVCNDIVFVGTYNSWATSDVAALVKFEAMEGFTNWYVCSFNDESESINGKPVQLKSDGSFAWDYQVGNQISLISGTATISDGYSDEVNIEGYGTEAPVVLSAGIWKQGKSPCVTVPKHNYTIVIDAPFCCDGDSTYFDPAIIGAFNGWSEGVAMTMDQQTFKYSYTFEDEEGHGYKFKAVGDTDWSNELQYYIDSTGTWSNFDNFVLPVATKDTTITWDFSDPAKYKYAKCGAAAPKTLDYTITVTVAPFCTALAAYADSVQVVGAFDNWTGTLMTMVSANVYTATVTAEENSDYKIKAGKGWDVEPVKNAEGDGLANQKWPYDETTVTLDLSEYSWKGCPQAVENVFENATINKVVVNGQLMIIVDGVYYNATGAQVK